MRLRDFFFKLMHLNTFWFTWTRINWKLYILTGWIYKVSVNYLHFLVPTIQTPFYFFSFLFWLNKLHFQEKKKWNITFFFCFFLYIMLDNFIQLYIMCKIVYMCIFVILYLHLSYFTHDETDVHTQSYTLKLAVYIYFICTLTGT